MGNSLRCCLACAVPCGALDVIRIVHLNGEVEEIWHSVKAADILRANPHHLLTQPCSQPALPRRISILSPEANLKRGTIYFLIPAASSPPDKKRRRHTNPPNPTINTACTLPHPPRRDRRTFSSTVWRPHLQTISED